MIGVGEAGQSAGLGDPVPSDLIVPLRERRHDQTITVDPRADEVVWHRMARHAKTTMDSSSTRRVTPDANGYGSRAASRRWIASASEFVSRDLDLKLDLFAHQEAAGLERHVPVEPPLLTQ